MRCWGWPMPKTQVLNSIFATLNTLTGPAVAEVVETMAFLCAAPLPDGVPAPAPAEACVKLTMPFTGPVAGVVEIVAPESLGSMMTANLLCSDSEKHDALLELLNMTCGLLFRSASVRFNGRFDIALPKLEDFDADASWDAFVSRAGVSFMDIEGVT